MEEEAKRGPSRTGIIERVSPMADRMIQKNENTQGIVPQDDLVTIGAKSTDPMTLSWMNPIKKILEIFQPKIEYGCLITYTIPIQYAQRLLEAEPYKYVLISPDELRVQSPVTPGGKVWITVKASQVVRDGTGKPVLDENKVPLLKVKA